MAGALLLVEPTRKALKFGKAKVQILLIKLVQKNNAFSVSKSSVGCFQTFYLVCTMDQILLHWVIYNTIYYGVELSVRYLLSDTVW